MELILQQELPHQQKAIDAVCAALDGVQINPPTQFYENPRIVLNDSRIGENIRSLWSAVPAEYRNSAPVIGNYLPLDIKMETGTGKTYVYTKTIYELHKRYRLNKFIIAVPSLAIKAGTAQFLQDEYARRHFTDACGYGTEIEVGVLEAPKGKKKGRSYFPGVVSDFVKGSCQNTKKIYVLLVNMQLLVVKANGLLSRDDYDCGAEGFYRPLDALRATKPVVMIDEPHRFSRDQKAFRVITDELKPQCIIRYGATFPQATVGRGRTRTTITDYQNLLYDLNACASFNQGLIKGVAKEHFEPVSKKEEKVKITSIASKTSVSLQYKKRDEATRSFTLQTGDSLGIISDAFEGVTVSEIGASYVSFSNGVTKTQGEELDVDIYMTSYQEQMLRLALERHFETEKDNFCNRAFKIKTLALFFIDDITSYRTGDDGKEPYLKEAFERLLKEQIQRTLAELDEHDAEYRAFLEASLADTSACHAGYFAQDNSDSDEEIAKEVDTILHGKKQLLSFRDQDGHYNTLRFLFSKWTLKEGWDNPNVFTIAKLRSSGSENSKLQEVGRGLRLPVDENGNRIANETFNLNYIVDFTEADFAEQLVKQINAEVPQTASISEEKLQAVAKKLGVSADDLFDTLYVEKRYIDRHRNIKPETRDAFFAEYPDFASGLSTGRVTDRNKDKPKPIKIRKAAYAEIKELWEKINQRYLLYYDSDINADLGNAILNILEHGDVFRDVTMDSSRDVVRSDGTQMSVEASTGVRYTVSHAIPYNVFLRRIMQATSIPIAQMHGAICKYVRKHGQIPADKFNDNSAVAFAAAFQEWRNTRLQGRFHYAKAGSPVGATALSNADGTPRLEITQGRIGTKIVPGTPSDKYLYDTFAFDSPLEKKNLLEEIDSVVVYGKIPRRSIAIPVITGGTYSPDFMYVVKKKSGEKELNIVVETKDVENKTDLRGEELVKIDCARVFFDTLTLDGYKVYFRDQLRNKEIRQIIEDVLASNETVYH